MSSFLGSFWLEEILFVDTVLFATVVWFFFLITKDHQDVFQSCPWSSPQPSEASEEVNSPTMGKLTKEGFVASPKPQSFSFSIPRPMLRPTNTTSSLSHDLCENPWSWLLCHRRREWSIGFIIKKESDWLKNTSCFLSICCCFLLFQVLFLLIMYLPFPVRSVLKLFK